MHIERLTLILEIVGQKGEATVADICAHSDLPKPSAYRLVHDLAGAGLLDPIAKGRFAIGNRLKRITEGDLSDQVLLDSIAPVLREAATDHGVAFFLSRVRGHAVEIIHVETPDTGVSFLHPGLGKRPLLDLDMRLGEGSGAMAAVPLVAMACAGVTEVPTYDEWFGR